MNVLDIKQLNCSKYRVHFFPPCLQAPLIKFGLLLNFEHATNSFMEDRNSEFSFRL